MEENKKENSIELEKLEYLQRRIFEVAIECIDTYSLWEKQQELATTQLSHMFMKYRELVTAGVSNPYRLKSCKSMINNIKKEINNLIIKGEISNDSTFEEIDRKVKETVGKIIKDYFATTLVVFTETDLTEFLESNDDEEIKKLEKLTEKIETYLATDSKNEERDISGTESKQLMDISNTFIDEMQDEADRAPTMVPLLNTTKISNTGEYYDQLIALLTLLRNASILCNEKNENTKSRYCASEIDITFKELVEELKEDKNFDKISMDEKIKILNEKAREAYMGEVKPFDIQLRDAIEQRKKLSDDDKVSCISEEEKKRYLRKLKHLKENLRKIKNDRLVNKIIDNTLEETIEVEADGTIPISVKVTGKKNRAKSNGFVAKYNTVAIYNKNNKKIIEYELQAITEFRNNLAKEGSAAHNFAIGNKSFDIRPLFKLKETSDDSEKDKEKLDLYCECLAYINVDNVGKAKKNDPIIKEIKEIIKYINEKIEVVDEVEIQESEGKTRKCDFAEYITSKIIYSGAEFGIISPAHGIEHNQAMVTPQNITYTLEDLLKSRRGLTELADMVREKYKKEINQKKGKGLSLDKLYELKHSEKCEDDHFASKLFSLKSIETDIQSSVENAENNIKGYTPINKNLILHTDKKDNGR